MRGVVGPGFRPYQPRRPYPCVIRVSYTVSEFDLAPREPALSQEPPGASRGAVGDRGRPLSGGVEELRGGLRAAPGGCPRVGCPRVGGIAVAAGGEGGSRWWGYEVVITSCAQPRCTRELDLTLCAFCPLKCRCFRSIGAGRGYFFSNPYNTNSPTVASSSRSSPGSKSTRTSKRKRGNPKVLCTRLVVTRRTTRSLVLCAALPFSP